MDERIEAFLQGVLGLETDRKGHDREAVRIAIAEYEKLFRDAELDSRKKNEAAAHCRKLCRARVLQEIDRYKGTQTEAHLRLVLNVLDGPARFPLHDDTA